MSLRETHYFKFNHSYERDMFIDNILSDPYYLAHYTYEREACMEPNSTSIQYMVCLDVGNFVNRSSPVTGLHIPVPLLAGEGSDNGR